MSLNKLSELAKREHILYSHDESPILESEIESDTTWLITKVLLPITAILITVTAILSAYLLTIYFRKIVTIVALQEVIPIVKSQFDFIYKKQTNKPPASNLYWNNHRLEALWTLSVLILVCLKIYKRFQQYRRYQSSTFIIGLQLTSDNDSSRV